MSLTVLPSAPPGALSGSLEPTETSVADTDGSPASETVTVAWTVWYLWFGGQSEVGDTDTDSVGGVASVQNRDTGGSWSVTWSWNSALMCTMSKPARSPSRWFETRMWSSVCELPSNTYE